MAEKTQIQLLQELYQAVIGIPENPDENGLIGKVDDLTAEVRLQNSRVRKNEQKISRIWGVLLGVGALAGTGVGAWITSLVGG